MEEGADLKWVKTPDKKNQSQEGNNEDPFFLQDDYLFNDDMFGLFVEHIPNIRDFDKKRKVEESSSGDSTQDDLELQNRFKTLSVDTVSMDATNTTPPTNPLIGKTEVVAKMEVNTAPAANAIVASKPVPFWNSKRTPGLSKQLWYPELKHCSRNIAYIGRNNENKSRTRRKPIKLIRAPFVWKVC